MKSQSEEASASLQDIANFFSANEYSVPKYQRDYAWKSKQISDLLNDLGEFAASKNGYYVLGQVITTPAKTTNKVRYLVDGQQRITSLYLLLLAIQRRNRELHINVGNSPAGQAIEDKIGPLLWSWAGSPPSKTPRFQGVENGRSFLYELIQGTENPTVISVSDKNLKSNFESIQRWLSDARWRLSSADALWEFSNRILDDVKIVNLRLSSEERAIDFFIKLNSRGIKLNAADLLKSLILKNANEHDYAQANEVWGEVSNALESAKRQPSQFKMPTGAANMEFLLGALIRKRTGQRYSKDQLFSAWDSLITKKNSEILSEPSPFGKLSVNEFITVLGKDGADLSLIGRGFKPMSAGSGISQNLIGTRTFKSFQHFNVLLAGNRLNEAAYEQLEILVEARAIIQIFSEEPSQDFEKILPKWAQRIHGLDKTASTSDVLRESLDAFKNTKALIARIPEFISKLRYSGIDGKPRQNDIDKIRYVLARANYLAAFSAGKQYKGLRMLMETTAGAGLSEPLDIDHVLAKSEKSVQKNWPKEEDSDLLQSVGNLTLLSSPKNKKAKDGSPETKEKKYASGSEPILTMSLSEKRHMSSDDRAIEEISRLQENIPPQLKNWSSNSIRMRTYLYSDLFVKDLERVIAFTKTGA